MFNKERYSLLAFLLLCVFQVQAAELSCPKGYVATLGSNDDGTASFCMPKNTLRSSPSCSGNTVASFNGGDYLTFLAQENEYYSQFSISFMTNTNSIDAMPVYVAANDMSGDYFYVYFYQGHFYVSGLPTGAFYPKNNSHKAGQWATYTVTYDGNQLILYVDGREVNRKQGNYRLANSIRLGSSYGRKYDISGEIDNVFIYERALSATEISELISDQAPSMGLLSHYNFEGDNPFENKAVQSQQLVKEGDVKLITTNNPACDAPLASMDSYTLQGNGETTELDVLANDVSDDKTSLVVTITNQSGLGGSATVTGQKLSYTTQAGYTGEDWIEYQVTNGQGLTSEVARVIIYIAKPGLPRSGLIAEYLFEDSNYLGLDSSGNNQHANNVGVTYDKGISNSLAARFDGKNDFLKMPALTPYLQYNRDFSFSLWAKKLGDGNYGLFSGGQYANAHSNRMLELTFYQQYMTIVMLKDYATSGGQQGYVRTPPPIPKLDLFYHFVVTYSRNILSFYLNGELVGTHDMQGHDWSHNYPYALGTRARNNITVSDSFDGLVDNVRFYNRALNEAEILQLLSEEQVPPLANADSFTLSEEDPTTELDILANDLADNKDSLSVAIINQSDVGGLATVSGQKLSYTPKAGYIGEDWVEYQLTDMQGLTSEVVRATITLEVEPVNISRNGLIAEYLFENTGNLGLDTSGNRLHASVKGVVPETGVRLGKSASFDGVDDYLSVPGLNRELQYSKDFTLSFWAKKDKLGDMGLFSGGQYSDAHYNHKLELTFYDKTIGLSLIENYARSSGKVVGIFYQQPRIGDFYHVLMRYQNNQASLYINNVKVGEGSMQGHDWSHHYSYVLGARVNNDFDPYDYFDGNIDNFRVYNRALSDSEITNLSKEFGVLIDNTPNANADSYELDINTSMVLPVMANDDLLGKQFGAITIETTPANGSVTVIDQRLRYTPNTGFFGKDKFSYSFTNSLGQSSNQALVAVEVFKGIATTPTFNPGGNYTPQRHIHYKGTDNDQIHMVLRSPDQGVTFRLVRTFWDDSAIPQQQIIEGPDIGYSIDQRTRISAMTFGDGYRDSEIKSVDYHFVEHIQALKRGEQGTKVPFAERETIEQAVSGEPYRQEYELTGGFGAPNVSAEGNLPGWLSVGIDYNQPYKLLFYGSPQEGDVGLHQDIKLRLVDGFKSKKTFSVSVEVLPGNRNPVVEKLTAVNGPNYTTNDAVQFQALVSDPDVAKPKGGTIAKVYFRLIKQGQQLQGWQVVEQTPWQFDFGQLAKGSYQVEVKAEDDLGGQSEIKSVNFEVKYIPGAIHFAWRNSEISVGQQATLEWEFEAGKVCRASAETQSLLGIGATEGINNDSASFTPYKAGQYNVFWLCEGETEAVEAVLQVKKLSAPTSFRKEN